MSRLAVAGIVLFASSIATAPPAAAATKQARHHKKAPKKQAAPAAKPGPAATASGTTPAATPLAADNDGSEFADVVGAGKTPPGAGRGGAAEEVESQASRPASGERVPGALDAVLAPRLVSRSISWNKDLSQSLSSPSVGNAPAVGFLVAWYPAAHFTRGWPTYLGVVASGEYAPGGDAQVGSATYPTSESDYWGGARVRIPFGALDAALTLGYGQHAFLIRDGTNASRAALITPDVKYAYVRAGLDARYELPARFALMGGVAYRDVLSAGSDGFGAQAAAFFPRATLTAIDLSVGAGYRFMSMLEARVGFDLRRYGFNMHPQASDQRIVSGAIDQYTSLWLGIAVLLDGKS